MNKNFNKLKRKNISFGKITGKVKYKTDLNLITDNTGFITDSFSTYYQSKFQFSDFFNKNIQDHSWISKPRFLLEAKKGKYYLNTPLGIELAFRDLIKYYQNLDDPLQRLYDGYHDSMFIRFVIKSGMFTTRQHWEMVMRNWEDGFRKTIDVYYRRIHCNYDPSMNLPYTVYFDTHFSNRLYYELLDVEYRNKQELIDCVEFVRLNQTTIDVDEKLYLTPY